MNDDTKNPFKGHNNPPETLQAEIENDNQDIIDRFNKLNGSIERMPAEILNDEVEGNMIDQIKNFKACKKEALARHELIKAPYLADGRIVDTVFKHKIEQPMIAAIKKFERILTTYQTKKFNEELKRREEEERKAKEAARKAEEEAAKAAEAASDEEGLDAAINADEVAQEATRQAEEAARHTDEKTTDITRTHATYGGQASMSQRTVHEITDRSKIDWSAIGQFIPVDAIDKAVRQYIKLNGGDADTIKQIEGINIFKQNKSTVR